MKALASTLATLSAIVLLTGCGAAGEAGLSASDGWSGPSDTMSCDDLAAHAVGMSEAQGAKLRLLKVRDPQVVKDNRSGDRASGAVEELILSCSGIGVWSDGGSTAEVQLRLTVDADGDEFVHYGLVEHQPLSAQSAL